MREGRMRVKRVREARGTAKGDTQTALPGPSSLACSSRMGSLSLVPVRLVLLSLLLSLLLLLSPVGL